MFQNRPRYPNLRMTASGMRPVRSWIFPSLRRTTRPRGLKLRTRNNPRYSWMDCGVPTSIWCQLPPVELRSEPFRMPGMWQCVPLGEREGLQRLAGAKHGAKSSLARTLLSLTVFYFCSTAWIWALDPGRRISQYSHTAWRIQEGVFSGAPSTITQTTDGYVWIGTLAGLVRFDGVRFVSFAPPAGQHLPNPAVISLLGATDGSLWIGTASGLAQWKNGELLTFPETAGRVNSIYEDRDGTIWIARSRTTAGGVCKVAVSVATCYAPKDGVPPYAQVLIKDNLGFFLIGHPTGIVRWQPGSSTSYEVPGLKSKPGLAGISDLALAPDGSVWVGIWSPGRGLRLDQLVNRSWKTFISPTLDGSRLRVNSLRLDRHNALWIATDGTGIYRVHDGNVDHFATADGLSSDSAGSFLEDKEGNLWLTTTAGVDCFRGTPVVSFSVHEGLSADQVQSILATRDGSVWIGNHGALDLIRWRHISSFGPGNGLSGDRTTSLFEDHAGRLWVGLDNRLFLYEHGRFIPVLHPDGS